MSNLRWEVCTRKGWQNRQSVHVGPLIVWVIENRDTQRHDVEIRTKQDVLFQQAGLESETAAKDRALNAARDLLQGWLDTVLGVSILQQNVA